MKLVYIRLEIDHEQLEIEYNLGSKFKFAYYESNNTLRVELNPNFLEGLYNNTNDKRDFTFNAIIGENGTGKTTILNQISAAISQKDGLYSVIYIFQDEDVYYYYSEQELKIENEVGCILKSQDVNKKYNIIRYSNVFDLTSRINRRIDLKKYKIGPLNYSTDYLIKNTNSISSFFEDEMIRQISFISSEKGKLYSKKNNLPQQIDVSFDVKNSQNLDVFKLLDDSETHSIFSNLIIGNHKNDKLSQFQETIIFYFVSKVMKLIESYLPYNLRETELKKFKIESLENLKYDNYKIEDIEEKINSYFKTNLQKEREIEEGSFGRDYVTIVENIKRINDKFNNPNNHLARFPYQMFESSDIEFFLEWSEFGIGKIEWSNLSSGEYALLSMISRLNDANEHLVQDSSIILLIDEGELYFHPQWQKEWVNLMKNILTTIYPTINSIQVITTTHSPFILSDIPADRVLFLERTENGVRVINNLEETYHTFGANINSLYAHSFFLKGSLMGNFAKNKINQIADEIVNQPSNNIYHNRERLTKFIQLIGEPIIRNKLLLILEEKIRLEILNRESSEDIIKAKIKVLEDRLAKLESEEN